MEAVAKRKAHAVETVLSHDYAKPIGKGRSEVGLEGGEAG